MTKDDMKKLMEQDGVEIDPRKLSDLDKFQLLASAPIALYESPEAAVMPLLTTLRMVLAGLDNAAKERVKTLLEQDGQDGRPNSVAEFVKSLLKKPTDDQMAERMLAAMPKSTMTH